MTFIKTHWKTFFYKMCKDIADIRIYSNSSVLLFEINITMKKALLLYYFYYSINF